MVTDADIKKLKGVFATKDDFQAMEERLRKDIVKDVAEMLQDGVIKILNDHERRLDRLEKTAGGFPPLSP